MSMNNKVSLKEMTRQVIADKMFGKAIEDYGEKSKRNVLVVTEFDNRTDVIVSANIARKLENKPELVKALTELFELENDDENDEDYSLLAHKRFHLPKLAVPFKDIERGWNSDLVSDQATLYLNILGYGNGGSKSLVDTKFKTAEKPEWWDDDNNFEKYSHPSKAKIKVNEDVIQSILKHFGYDPDSHCEFPQPKERKKRKPIKKKNIQVLGESILEDDPAILELRVDTNDNRDDNDNDDAEDADIPKKKSKQQLSNPDLSFFEVNVMQNEFEAEFIVDVCTEEGLN